MPTRKEVSKLKQDHVTKRQDAIDTKIITLQESLYENVSTALLTYLSKKKEDPTYDSTFALQQVVKKEFNKSFPDVMKETVNAGRSIGNLTEMYYSTLMDSNRLDDIRDKTAKILDRSLGIDENGKIKQGGFIDRALADEEVQKKFIKEVKKVAATGADVQVMQEKMKQFVVGQKESNGFIQQYYKSFAGDLINTIDRNNGNIYADDLELKYFYYAGGLILSSRPFCIKRNGKIISRDQAALWKNDSEIKQMYKGRMDEYEPLKCMGGPHCLHNPDWITDELAQGNIREQNKKAADRSTAFKELHNL